jgi:hypothetical protein
LGGHLYRCLLGRSTTEFGLHRLGPHGPRDRGSGDWGAKWPDNARFPTISGTVGYLEYWHDWVALLAIGVLVWAAFHLFEFRGPKAYKDSDRHTLSGRYTLRKPQDEPFSTGIAIGYYVVAIASTIAGSLIVNSARPDDEYLLGEVMYGSIALFAFVLPGAAAHADDRMHAQPAPRPAVLARRLRDEPNARGCVWAGLHD